MIGFVFPDTACSLKEYISFYNNTAISTVAAFMFNRIGSTCGHQGWIKGALSKRGVVINPTQPGVNMENIIMAENDVSVILRQSQNSLSNPNEFRNWYVTAFARPGCP